MVIGRTDTAEQTFVHQPFDLPAGRTGPEDGSGKLDKEFRRSGIWMVIFAYLDGTIGQRTRNPEPNLNLGTRGCWLLVYIGPSDLRTVQRPQ